MFIYKKTSNWLSPRLNPDEYGKCYLNSIEVRVKLLLARLEVYINIILLRFGHIPEVAEKCHEILDVINSNRLLNYPIIICGILFVIIVTHAYVIMGFFMSLIEKYRYYPILYNIFCQLYLLSDSILTKLTDLYDQLDCPNPYPPPP